MPSSFVVFELLCDGLFVACAIDAYRRRRLGFVLVGAVYGVLLEHLTIATLSFYEYGRFTVMIGNAPLAIGLAWAAILYSSHRLASSKTSGLARTAALATVIALTIDLAMDAIALREGFWIWHAGGVWFGVPFLNFVAWSIVVFAYCFLFDLFRRRHPVLVAAAMSMGFSLLILIPGDWLLLRFTREIHHLVLFVGIMVVCLAAAGKAFLARVGTRNVVPALCVTLLHVYFLALLLMRDYRSTGLIVVSVIMLVAGVALHGTFATRPTIGTGEAGGPRPKGG